MRRSISCRASTALDSCWFGLTRLLTARQMSVWTRAAGARWAVVRCGELWPSYARWLALKQLVICKANGRAPLVGSPACQPGHSAAAPEKRARRTRRLRLASKQTSMTCAQAPSSAERPM